MHQSMSCWKYVFYNSHSLHGTLQHLKLQCCSDNIDANDGTVDVTKAARDFFNLSFLSLINKIIINLQVAWFVNIKNITFPIIYHKQKSEYSTTVINKTEVLLCFCIYDSICSLLETRLLIYSSSACNRLCLVDITSTLILTSSRVAISSSSVFWAFSM